MYSLEALATQFLNGISLVTILILVSVGLGIIYGLMGIINLAHGAVFTVGVYTAMVVVRQTGSFWAGVLAAPIAVGALGWLMERTLIRNLYGRPMETILATFGFSLVLEQAIRMIFGALPQRIDNPIPGVVHFLGLTYPAYRLFIILAGLVVIGLVFYLFQRTDFGLQARSVIQNKEMALALGVNSSRIYQLAFALGTGLAGLAGALMSPMINVIPTIGGDFLARSFFVVIVGGASHLIGTVLGSFIIGEAETILSFSLPPILAQALVLLVAVVIVRIKPQGLLSRK